MHCQSWSSTADADEVAGLIDGNSAYRQSLHALHLEVSEHHLYCRWLLWTMTQTRSLSEWDAKAAEAIDLHCDQGPVACIQVSSLSARMLLIGSSPSCLMRLVYRAAAHAIQCRPPN